MIYKLLFVTFSTLSLLHSKTSGESLVDYYIKLIDNQTRKALEYEFPTDARMYEAKNTNIKGKWKWNLRYSMKCPH